MHRIKTRKIRPLRTRCQKLAVRPVRIRATELNLKFVYLLHFAKRGLIANIYSLYLLQDDDEGIDVRTEGCTSSTSCASGASNGDQNRKNRRQGQYNYELFSIMIHSGSASGGHYYAYIKDFVTREW